MARISADRKAQLEQFLPPTDATVASARTYMARADLSIPQFAKICGYSESAISMFLNGTYLRHRETDLPVRQAIEQAMTRHPVVVMSDAAEGKLYETENVADIRRLFTYCHAHQALAFVYGPPGSQKTFVFQHIVAEFNRREVGRDDSRNRAFLVRASIGIRPRDLIAKLCREVGATVGPGLQACMSNLRAHLRGTKTLIVLDEAQLCGIPALEALRELHDMDPKLGILLGGSHNLKQFFDARAAELEQWNSRLHEGIELSGVSDGCARAILTAECPDLDADAITQIIEAAKVADIYSRDRTKRYLSVRRLFNSIAAYHRLIAEAQEAA